MSHAVLTALPESPLATAERAVRAAQRQAAAQGFTPALTAVHVRQAFQVAYQAACERHAQRVWNAAYREAWLTQPLVLTGDYRVVGA
jgi:hypothetical protein